MSLTERIFDEDPRDLTDAELKALIAELRAKRRAFDEKTTPPGRRKKKAPAASPEQMLDLLNQPADDK